MLWHPHVSPADTRSSSKKNSSASALRHAGLDLRLERRNEVVDGRQRDRPPHSPQLALQLGHGLGGKLVTCESVPMLLHVLQSIRVTNCWIKFGLTRTVAPLFRRTLANCFNDGIIDDLIYLAFGKCI